MDWFGILAEFWVWGWRMSWEGLWGELDTDGVFSMLNGLITSVLVFGLYLLMFFLIFSQIRLSNIRVSD